MKPAKNNLDLPDTLSRRVSVLREMRNLTRLDLSRVSRLPLNRIDAIESGQEIWLSVTDRSNLARALAVSPDVLKEVECCPTEILIEEGRVKDEDLDLIVSRILAGEVNIPCPKCRVVMKVSVENALDFEGNPIRFARAYCPSCPFCLR